MATPQDYLVISKKGDLCLEMTYSGAGRSPVARMEYCHKNITLDAGFAWKPEEGRANTTAVAVVYRGSDGQCLLPALKARLIAAAERAGEAGLVAHLKGGESR